MFLFTLQNDSDLKTMVDNRSLTAAAAAAAARAIEIEHYETQTRQWNESEYVEERREERERAINNTPGYRNGNRVHHIRTIQVPNAHLWNQLFGREVLDPILRQYAQASLEYYAQLNTANPLPFAGQIDVSMMMMENYRPRIHVAIFIVYLSPHRAFHDGHIICIEFSEGSNTHQIVTRMFDPNEYAVVEQATEYEMLQFAASNDEMLDLLHSYFIDDDFNTMKFTYHNEGYYTVDPDFQGQHLRHYTITMGRHAPPPGVAAGAAAEEAYDDDDDDDDDDDEAVRIPPPPPVNNFTEIYQQNIIQYNDINIVDYNDDNVIADDQTHNEPANG
jgi:hypothetical protein